MQPALRKYHSLDCAANKAASTNTMTGTRASATAAAAAAAAAVGSTMSHRNAPLMHSVSIVVELAKESYAEQDESEEADRFDHSAAEAEANAGSESDRHDRTQAEATAAQADSRTVVAAANKIDDSSASRAPRSRSADRGRIAVSSRAKTVGDEEDNDNDDDDDEDEDEESLSSDLARKVVIVDEADKILHTRAASAEPPLPLVGSSSGWCCCCCSKCPLSGRGTSTTTTSPASPGCLTLSGGASLCHSNGAALTRIADLRRRRSTSSGASDYINKPPPLPERPINLRSNTIVYGGGGGGGGGVSGNSEGDRADLHERRSERRLGPNHRLASLAVDTCSGRDQPDVSSKSPTWDCAGQQLEHRDYVPPPPPPPGVAERGELSKLSMRRYTHHTLNLTPSSPHFAINHSIKLQQQQQIPTAQLSGGRDDGTNCDGATGRQTTATTISGTLDDGDARSAEGAKAVVTSATPLSSSTIHQQRSPQHHEHGPPPSSSSSSSSSTSGIISSSSRDWSQRRQSLQISLLSHYHHHHHHHHQQQQQHQQQYGKGTDLNSCHCCCLPSKSLTEEEFRGEREFNEQVRQAKSPEVAAAAATLQHHLDHHHHQRPSPLPSIGQKSLPGRYFASSFSSLISNNNSSRQQHQERCSSAVEAEAAVPGAATPSSSCCATDNNNNNNNKTVDQAGEKSTTATTLAKQNEESGARHKDESRQRAALDIKRQRAARNQRRVSFGSIDPIPRSFLSGDLHKKRASFAASPAQTLASTSASAAFGSESGSGSGSGSGSAATGKESSAIVDHPAVWRQRQFHSPNSSLPNSIAANAEASDDNIISSSASSSSKPLKSPPLPAPPLPPRLSQQQKSGVAAPKPAVSSANTRAASTAAAAAVGAGVGVGASVAVEPPKQWQYQSFSQATNRGDPVSLKSRSISVSQASRAETANSEGVTRVGLSGLDCSDQASVCGGGGGDYKRHSLASSRPLQAIERTSDDFNRIRHTYTTASAMEASQSANHVVESLAPLQGPIFSSTNCDTIVRDKTTSNGQDQKATDTTIITSSGQSLEAAAAAATTTTTLDDDNSNITNRLNNNNNINDNKTLDLDSQTEAEAEADKEIRHLQETTTCVSPASPTTDKDPSRVQSIMASARLRQEEFARLLEEHEQIVNEINRVETKMSHNLTSTTSTPKHSQLCGAKAPAAAAGTNKIANQTAVDNN